MTVSILIAAYQAAPFIQQALDCVRTQSHPDWELVVVEDGSDDGTASIIANFAREFPHQVRYDRNPENLGVSATRNRLLKLARGEILAFLDADDFWHPNHLAALVSCLADGHAIGISGIETWDGDRQQVIRTYTPPPEILAHSRLALFKSSFIQSSSCVAIPRASLENVGLFDTDLRIGEDRDFWFRVLSEGGTLGCTGAITCRYIKHPNSAMTQTLRVASDTVRFYEKHQYAPGIPPALARSCLVNALRTHGRLIRKTNPSAARSTFLRAWRLQPWSLDLLLHAGLVRH